MNADRPRQRPTKEGVGFKCCLERLKLMSVLFSEE